MNKFKVGDLVKVKGENIVFEVYSMTQGGKHVPDGWLIGIDCGYHNPDMCELYKGAISVFEREG